MHTLTFMVYLIYGVSFWIVYLIIFIQMMRPMYQKYFSSSFFTLAKILAVVDLCGHIVFTCLFKIPISNLFGPLFAKVTPNYGWSVLYFVGYIEEFIRAMLILATTLNRLTSLIWPHSHESRWKTAMPGVIAICFVVPFCLSFQRLFAPTGVIPTDPVNELFVFSTNLLDWYPNELNALTMASFYAIVGTATVIVNLSSLLTLYLYKRDQKLHLHHRKSIRKTEIGLVLVSFGDAVGMMLMTAVQNLQKSEIKKLQHHCNFKLKQDTRSKNCITERNNQK
uniref:Serpentine receptor class gamma n=1 Tax=Panagrellus redivivus TaxID=6233 RepID=A0A7E4WBB9_PANRE